MIDTATSRPSAVSRLRRRLGRLRRTRMMVREVRDRVKAQAREQERLTAKVAEQAKQLDSLSRRLETFEKRFDLVERGYTQRDLEHGRLAQQMGAVEYRLAEVEDRLEEGTFVADDASTAEARSIVEAVRREHEQIRVRMQVISSYEERLRRVEMTAAELYDGDTRHRV